MVKIAFALSLALSASALAQQVSTSQPAAEIAGVSNLPDAPSFKGTQNATSETPEAGTPEARKLEGHHGIARGLDEHAAHRG